MKYLRSILLFVSFGSGVLVSQAQTRKTENLIIVGWDGVRWQEIFTGVDSAIMNDRAYTKRSSEMRAQFWDNDVNVRRKKLLPFFWGILSQQGQLYGNRTLGNKVEVANRWSKDDAETRLWFAASLAQEEAQAQALGRSGPLALTGRSDFTKLAAWFEQTNRARVQLRSPLRQELLLLEALSTVAR